MPDIFLSEFIHRSCCSAGTPLTSAICAGNRRIEGMMIGSLWKVRNLDTSAFRRMALLVLLLFGLLLLSGANWAVALSPRSFPISGHETLSIHGRPEAPRTLSLSLRQSHGPIYSA